MVLYVVYIFPEASEYYQEDVFEYFFDYTVTKDDV